MKYLNKLDYYDEVPKGWRPPPVTPDVAGDVHIRTVDFKKILCENTRKVWVRALQFRLPHGRLSSSCTNSILARGLKMSVRMVERAMQKLRQAKLLETEGDGWYTYVRLKNGCMVRKKVFFRRMLGTWIDGQLFFPKKCINGLYNMKKRGGQLRPRRVEKPLAVLTDARLTIEELVVKAKSCGSIEAALDWLDREVWAGRLTIEDYTAANIGVLNRSVLYGTCSTVTSTAAMSPCQSKKEHSVSTRNHMGESDGQNGDLDGGLWPEYDGLRDRSLIEDSSLRSEKNSASKIGAEASPPFLTRAQKPYDSNNDPFAPPVRFKPTCTDTPKEEVVQEPVQRVLPPYPSTALLGCVVTPNPPFITDEMPDEQAVNLMIKAYRGAAGAKLSSKVYAFSKGNIVDSKYYPQLVDAAKALREHGIPPAAWAAWCIDYWVAREDEKPAKTSTKKRSKRKLPPITFIFNAKYIVARRGHFRHEMEGYFGGRICLPTEFNALYGRYFAMELALMRSGASTPEQQSRIVEEHFPGGWERHYDRVKQATLLDKARMQRLVNSGAWLW